jgi:L-iditol 2-dehydrogenase
MLAAFVGTGGHAEVRQVLRPVLKDGDIMVRMKASGICGTDLEKLSGAYDASTILGHEVSGTVSESKSEFYSPGDKVIPHHHVACGSCFYCKSKSETMCEQFKKSNFDPGGFSEEFRVAHYNVERRGVHRFEQLSFEEASFVEPLGCCIRGLEKCIPKLAFQEGAMTAPVRNILVVGAGPIGLLHMELLRSILPEAMLSAVDVSEKRLEFASVHEKAMPINARSAPNGNFSEVARRSTDGHGFDLVIVATGNPSVFGEALRSLRKSGKLLLFGAMHKGSTFPLDLQLSLLNELTLTSSYATTEDEMDTALRLLEEKKINVAKFVTGNLPLSRIDEAMTLAKSETQVKVLVTAN